MTIKGKTVAYLYDEELGNYSYGGGNPMRPHRVRLTHSLVENYGLGSRMLQHRPNWQSQDEISQFHADGERRCWSSWCIPAPLSRNRNINKTLGICRTKPAFTCHLLPFDTRGPLRVLCQSA